MQVCSETKKWLHYHDYFIIIHRDEKKKQHKIQFENVSIGDQQEFDVFYHLANHLNAHWAYKQHSVYK